MATFHELTVSEVRRETEESVSVKLEIPQELESAFKFIPGQYVTFKQDINGEEVRRSYSICSAPYENELRVGIKKIPQGRFSTYANEVLKEGDTLGTMEPTGRFLFHSNGTASRHFVGLAGGSGITPVLSILKDVLHSEPNSKFSLFYGNRNSNSVIFREQLARLKNEYMNRLVIHHVLSEEEVRSDLFQGMMTKEKVAALLDKLVDVKTVDGFYICGPEPMIIGAKDVLKESGIADDKVHFELFGTSTQTSTDQPKQAAVSSTEENVQSTVTVVLDDDEFEFELDSDGKTVLEAATDAGVDVPFSCKGAVCCTCLARVKDGEASMDKNYSLSEKEVADGLILTCQAHPRSKSVTFDFDDIW